MDSVELSRFQGCVGQVWIGIQKRVIALIQAALQIQDNRRI
jgi:hypothetical protein